MKVLYYGWYGNGNVGDEMYKVAFPVLFPGHTNRFRSSLTADDVEWADQIVIGGGNIIDRHFLKNVHKHVPVGKPLHYYSVGCTDHSVVKEDFDRFTRIWVRDEASHQGLQSLGVSCDLAPDAAWVMKPDRENGSRIWKHLFEHEKHDLYEKKVVVVLNAHLTSIQPDSLARDESRFFTFVHDLIQIIDNTPASFAFVPFGRQMRWDDRAPNSWVAHKCKWHRKNFVLWDGSWSVQDTLDFIAAADAMISTRLHATIFACMGGTPFVDVTHHDKNRAFLRSVNLEDWSVPYWDFSRERSWSLLKNHLDQDYAHDFYKTFEGLASERCAALLSYAKGLKFISA